MQQQLLVISMSTHTHTHTISLSHTNTHTHKPFHTHRHTDTQTHTMHTHTTQHTHTQRTQNTQRTHNTHHETCFPTQTFTSPPSCCNKILMRVLASQPPKYVNVLNPSQDCYSFPHPLVLTYLTPAFLPCLDTLFPTLFTHISCPALLFYCNLPSLMRNPELGSKHLFGPLHTSVLNPTC